MFIYIVNALGVGRLPGRHHSYEVAEKKMLKAARKYGGASMDACCDKCWETMEPRHASSHVCKDLNAASPIHDIMEKIAEQNDLAIDERSLEKMLQFLDEKGVG